MISLPMILSLAATSATQSDLPLGERMDIGIEVTIIVLLTVFAALIVIWGVLELFRVVFYREGKTGDQAQTQKAETSPEPAPSGDDAATVAAITAAIAAYTGKSASSLRVVRFTRK